MYYCLECTSYSRVDEIEFDDDIGYCPICDSTTDDMILVNIGDLPVVDLSWAIIDRCQCEDYPCCGH